MNQIQKNTNCLWYEGFLSLGSKFSKSCMLAFTVMAVCFASSAHLADAQTAQTPAVFKQFADGVYRYELDNGLRVLFFKRDHAPVFYAQTWVKVGSVDEAPEDYGLSDLMEHIAYKGERKLENNDSDLEVSLREELKGLEGLDHELARARVAILKSKLKEINVSSELVDLYKKQGAVGLMADANTDYTVYGVELPKSQLEFWCWLESDRLMNPAFSYFDSAKKALGEEHRQSVTDGADGMLYHAMTSLSSMPRLDRVRAIAWPPYEKEASVEHARDFYRMYYRPDNIVLSIVGDLDPDDVEELTEKYFSKMPEGRDSIRRLQVEGQLQSRAVDIDVETRGEEQVLVGYQKPTWPDEADVHYTVLQSVLGGGRPSLLYRDLVSKKRVAKSVFVSKAPLYRDPSVFVVGATPRRGVENDRLLSEIYSSLDRAKTTLFEESVVASAKRRVRVSMFKDLKSNAGVAEILGKSELLWGDWEAIVDMYSVLIKTQPKDLRKIARDHFAIDKRITLRQRAPRGR